MSDSDRGRIVNDADPSDDAAERREGGHAVCLSSGDADAIVEVTPDLAAPTHPLDPVFPRAFDQTGVVLYTGAPGELRMDWSLLPNDFMSYGAGFPAAGGPPEAVLRLRRARLDGGSELVDEIPLRRSSLGGQGEAVVWVGRDYSRFEAELGLTNTEGGWLLLARSNRLQHATGLGLQCLTQTVAPVPARSGAESPTPGDQAQSQDPDPLTSALRRPVSPASTVDMGFQKGSEMPATTDSGDRAPGLLADGESLRERPLLPPLTERDTPARMPVSSHDPASAGDGSCGQNATLTAFRIPTLRYGKPAASGADLVIEAELRIFGWAAPNSEIDLFGRRYPVGPGGRFQLVLKVDDPDLLRRALAQHPPPELGGQHDD